MNMVFKYFVASLCLTLIFSACGSKNDHNQDLTYAEAYDRTIMRIPLDSLAKLSGVEAEDLIGVRFGVNNEDTKLTLRLIEILNALEDNDEGKLDKLGKSKTDIIIKKSGSNIREEQLKAIYAIRNNDFGQELPEIVSSFLNKKIDEYIDTKYSLLTAIPNTWNYYTKTDEDFTNDFLKEPDFNKVQYLANEYYVASLNNYKNTLSEEILTLTGSEISIPDFNVLPGDESIESSGDLKNLVAERTKSQIREISSDIFWDIIIDIIICAIISFFMNLAIDDAGQRAVEKFLKNLRKKKGESWWKATIRTGFMLLGAYGEYEEEVKAIKLKYKRYKFITGILIFLVGFAFTWYFVIKPQLHIENELNQELSAELMNSSSTLKVNPTRLLNLYLNIDSHEINSSEKYLVDTVNGIEDAEVVEEIVPEVVASSIEKETFNDKSNYKYSGKIGDYPIVLQLEKDGNDITGKYAYQSTLKKYGDKPASYFYLSGNIDASGNLNLMSKMHKSNDVFEYITLNSEELFNGSTIGELKNANTGHIYTFEVHRE